MAALFPPDCLHAAAAAAAAAVVPSRTPSATSSTSGSNAVLDFGSLLLRVDDDPLADLLLPSAADAAAVYLNDPFEPLLSLPAMTLPHLPTSPARSPGSSPVVAPAADAPFLADSLLHDVNWAAFMPIATAPSISITDLSTSAAAPAALLSPTSSTSLTSPASTSTLLASDLDLLALASPSSTSPTLSDPTSPPAPATNGAEPLPAPWDPPRHAPRPLSHPDRSPWANRTPRAKLMDEAARQAILVVHAREIVPRRKRTRTAPAAVDGGADVRVEVGDGDEDDAEQGRAAPPKRARRRTLGGNQDGGAVGVTSPRKRNHGRRRAERKRKNRLAAHASRERARAHLDELKAQLANLVHRNTDLHADLIKEREARERAEKEKDAVAARFDALVARVAAAAPHLLLGVENDAVMGGVPLAPWDVTGF
ncbi:hypothetical protein AMAG_05092 [Allomyces macrogynus ATCC 38327]|uniref:BZIP domain-containing protein n=1 Tax=Allomyces macrogynus (strain ATCC 38327) TaxID=578462 RepID=A0A0L0S6P7_ALLM3|nr:hypothetical protein AMAG_05092 [Allomyces macrogynus ATCC 38327]|eukprot:KNE58283.1 hypothetical protein AMAG_05092 [Allomyces macrogynus ATCC 38327]